MTRPHETKTDTYTLCTPLSYQLSHICINFFNVEQLADPSAICVFSVAALCRLKTTKKRKLLFLQHLLHMVLYRVGVVAGPNFGVMTRRLMAIYGGIEPKL